MSSRVDEAIRHHAKKLADVSDSPQLDCQLLLCHLLGRTRAWLYAHATEPLSDRDLAHLTEATDRRLAGEPVAYITGVRSFRNRDFYVTEDTMTPRPETELLVEILLDRFDHSPRSVLDLGTGSGAIAVSLALERPAWRIIGIDSSRAALKVAKRNGAGLGNVSWQHGSWYGRVNGVVDLVVSNPPYIAEGDRHLAALQREPMRAFSAGPDGLACIRAIIGQGRQFLAPGGALLLEHGHEQQGDVMALFAASGYTGMEAFLDLGGRPRAVLAMNPMHR